VTAVSRPSDFGGVSYTRHEQTGSLLSEAAREEKVVRFVHGHCRAIARVSKAGKPEKVKQSTLLSGATDVLSALFFLRTINFELGTAVSLPVHASGENYWLSITPVALERIEVPAGLFEALHLDIRATRDGESEERNHFEVWLATEHPNRPILILQAELELGRLTLRLDEFIPGNRS
jgi:hypothetical protein